MQSNSRLSSIGMCVIPSSALSWSLGEAVWRVSWQRTKRACAFLVLQHDGLASQYSVFRNLFGNACSTLTLRGEGYLGVFVAPVLSLQCMTPLLERYNFWSIVETYNRNLSFFRQLVFHFCLFYALHCVLLEHTLVPSLPFFSFFPILHFSGFFYGRL
jgi:hypothetical protein